MPAIGLVVAGPYDAAVLEVFTRRLRPGVSVVSRLCGNDAGVLRTCSARLREFERGDLGRPVERAVIVCDSHQADPAALDNRLRASLTGSRVSFPVRHVVIIRELEAWLLADHAALARLAAERGRPTNFLPLNFPPEQLPDPKGKLTALLQQAGVGYTHVVAGRLAEHSDLDLIEGLCPSFTSFKRAVAR